MRLSEAIEALAIATRANGRSPRTVDSYRQKLRPLVGFLGDVAVEGITTDDLRRFIAHLMDRETLYVGHPSREERPGSLSPFTVLGHVRAMRRLFNWLEYEERIERNPMRRIKTPQPRRREPKGIRRGDFLALLATTRGGSTKDLRDRAIILFLADTGCRVGGLCGLRLDDLDLGRRLAALAEKGGRFRLVPFTPTTAYAIRDWLRVRPEGKGDTLFVGLGNRAHDAVTPNSVAKMLAIRARGAGITGPVNPHSFRHAFARDYLMAGGDLATLSDLMGHINVLVTKEYYGVFTFQELQRKHAQFSPIAQMFGGEEENDGDQDAHGL